MVHFHSKTLKLLNVSPMVSPSAVSELERAESRLGRTLPVSVKEWYSLGGACQILLQYSNGDQPLEVSEFGLPRNDTNEGGPHDLSARDLVIFRHENQGVCIWAFRLDGSDDPPVCVDVDSQCRNWTQCASTFSEHLYAWMWDFSQVLNRDLLIQAQNQPVTESALDFLRKTFETGPETYGWPGHTQYRFFRGDKRILIWASKDQADWWLTADQEESLRQMVGQVRECDQVGKSMWSHSKRGQAVLQ